MNDQTTTATALFTDLKPRERAVYEIAQEFSRAGVKPQIEELGASYEDRFRHEPQADVKYWGSTSLEALVSLIEKGWLDMEEGRVTVTRAPSLDDSLQALETALQQVTASLPEDVRAMPELYELVNAMNVAGRWTRIFEAIRKAG
jgi:hypothetical protein